MKILVCGGRDFSDADRLCKELDQLVDVIAPRKITEVIHGGGGSTRDGVKGADLLAGHWAVERKIPVTVFPANWRAYGKAAGPIRNQQMIDEGEPDLVLAFPGGAGTADMVERARKAGIRVVEFSAA